MPADRFYLNTDFALEKTVYLEDAEHHHLSHVMKLTVGEEIELINGQGLLGLAKISEISKKKTLLKIISIKKTELSSPRFILAVPLMRPSKLEWVIEKGTELGADAFILFKAIHSEKENVSEHQMERFHNLMIAACKQSGRLYLPSIEILPDLNTVFKHKALFLFGDIRDSASKELPKSDSIVFISGPERGFTEIELEYLKNSAIGIKLNENVLRAETAPIAAISILGRFRLI